MTAVSGQYGKIMIGSSTLAECTKWSFDREVSIHGYNSCATSGYKKKITGSHDGKGTLEGVLDPADVIENYIEEGDSVTLKLYYSATKYHSVPAVIAKLGQEVDIEEGDIVRWTADFEANGQWTPNQS